ncbi:transcription initiation factor TFIID subunit 2 isoform X2 [Actinidia eriantha]|uniref:transcription initiation factor TFIID subunit 2 isoform X2 n=1 Tax=Actinidia eriantha TaxID=165200 RepID=UPI00258E2386|nr:transcription initiation factor TFIID subunit 2 isoform X2 [Actinidia eriantha]
MAKPRKPKNEEQKVDNSEAVVRHQKLCLSIDMDQRRVYGYTELEIVVPDNGVVGLHADNLEIERVTVDGEPAEFEVFPHNLHLDSENRWCAVSSATSAADAAGSVYLSSLERELVPNLLIMCSKSVKSVSELQGEQNSGSGLCSSEEPNQNVRLVRVDYWVEKAETGIHFEDNILHTDSQIRRARCWFPCMDDSSQRCCYDLEFTVANNFVAVSAGKLLYQVLSKDGHYKTYVYRLNIPVAARWILLVVAPFEILPDRHSSLLSYMCLPANLSKLRNTVGFFHSAFSHYEDYLSASFPFGSYTQVFIAPEMAISSMSLGASIIILSSQVLFDEKVIDQTIETRIKLASALARQWFGVYITAEEPNDEWLLDGLAGFLTDSFIKRFLGNNEARYRRYKANCAVCKADDSGATALSFSASSRDLYGTQCIGLFGKIRSWKSVAVLQMLEKQMGPESFRKILQTIVYRAQDTSRPLRTLSTKEFRHFANKVGNLERPFLKEFFPRWVGSCGCPVLRMGFSYNKRKNMVELAVMRGCTATSDSIAAVANWNTDSDSREGDGWPGMMSIRVHELDGMYDHPILPMAGETWQLLEIQCHSKLAAKRFQKPKKGSKPDGSDDNGDTASAIDMRPNADSPLLWVRADPEMEYLAEINFNQPVQMWINQLEKDKDVVAQAQAIVMLEALPQLSFSVVNALNNFLVDAQVFWRVRIEAAFALANTATEETDWAGLLHLIKFYKSRRFDANIGLPKPNDFHDFPEYFVLEAIPNAIAMVRAADKKSPREAVEFVLQLLKYNDNNGNPYSDVFWVGALVQSIGELEFGQQTIPFLSSLLKRIDRLLQFDRLMPSYNGILMISCIRTLTQVSLKLSDFVPLDRVIELIKPFRDFKTMWQVRIEASKALLDLEFHRKGINSVLMMFIKYLEEEPSLRGQAKLGVHVTRLCQIRSGSDLVDDVKSETLVSLLRLLESPMAFNNVILRHYLFCILQVLAGRPPTLYGVPRDESMQMGHAQTSCELKNIFAALVKQSKPPEFPMDAPNIIHMEPTEDIPNASHTEPTADISNLSQPKPAENILSLSQPEPTVDILKLPHMEPSVLAPNLSQEGLVVPETSKEAETVSNSCERGKPLVKIRVKRSAASSRAEDVDNVTVEKSQGGHNDGPSSSISVDAPQRNFTEAVSTSNQNIEEVNSCHDSGSRMTASIGSAKLASEGDEFGKELQCTADSSKVSALPPHGRSSPSIMKDNGGTKTQKYASLQTLSVPGHVLDSVSLVTVDPRSHSKEKGKKKDKDKKRKRDERKGHRDDPEYLERKRLKKEKKQREKEMAKLMSVEAKASSSIQLQNLAMISEEAKRSSTELQSKKDEAETRLTMVSREGKSSPVELRGKEQELGSKAAMVQLKAGEPKMVVKMGERRADASEANSTPKFRIKIKNRTLNKS